MATTKKTPASEAKPKHGRVPRLRTNVVVGEDAAGDHYCIYSGPSADRALSMYAELRADGGHWIVMGIGVRFVRAVLILDPRTAKHCSFAS